MAQPEVVEVCPRDGLQNEDTALSAETRADLIDRLAVAGARRIEAVSFVNPKRVPQMAGAEQVLELLNRRPDVRYAGLVLNERGLDRALACDLDEVNFVVPCTEEMARRNQNTDVEAIIAATRSMVATARAAGLFATVTAAVAFGCPFSGEVPPSAVARVVDAAAEAGADEIALADTIGVGVPDQVRRLVDVVTGVAENLPLRFHFHNTRNTGYANAMRAVDLGAAALDASVGGLGGCPFAPAATGNIATEDLNYALSRSGYDTGLDHEQLVATAKWIGGELGKPVPALLGRAGPFPASARSGDICG